MDVLLSEEMLRKRVAELGAELTEYYRGKPLTLICLLNGAMIFASDLMRHIDLPVQYDSFAVSSYVNTQSTGELKVRSALKLPVAGRHILLVDDILDTGFTMKCIIRDFMKVGALSVKCCVLLNKTTKDKLFTTPDWVGFEVPERFVVGYGLDCDEEYRNLPFIGTLD